MAAKFRPAISATARRPAKKPHGSTFHIALDAGNLTGKPNIGSRIQAHLIVQKRGRVDKRIPVNSAKPRKAGVFKTGDHFENIDLRAIFHLGLKAHDVEKRAQKHCRA